MIEIGPVHRREYEIPSGRSEPVVIGEAPGRIHYLGEHGEPNAGLFLSSGIDRCMRVAVSLRKDSSLRFYAPDLGERKRTTLVSLKYKREDRWANFLKLGIYFFAEMGCPIGGLNMTVTGNIPRQLGLGSSRAIEVAAVIALKHLFKVNIHEKDLINRLNAEKSRFFGKDASPVDYLVMFNAKKDQFLLVDEASGEVKRVKSPLTKYKILIMDSKVPRIGVEEELRQRTEDIKKGLEILSHKKPGGSFRDYSASDLVEYMGNLPEGIRRRSMHVVQETARVRDAWDALEKSDLSALAKILFHSHESLRDLYDVSCPEIDWLVKRAQETESVAGARMTGPGFGGCTYTFIKESAVADFQKRMDDYEKFFGFHPVTHEVKIATGARIIPG